MMMTLEEKYVVIPANHVENALRVPSMWAQGMSLKDAETSAKELASRHGKRYTVMKVVSSFSPAYKVSKEK